MIVLLQQTLLGHEDDLLGQEVNVDQVGAQGQIEDVDSSVSCE